jgi:tRNA pseudouridine32 synthase / 23S rRNA pseudouridine746 synthase
LSATYINEFRQNVTEIELPNKFTFPFYYDPHPLAIIASNELQNHIQSQTKWHHNFGIDKDAEGLAIGKMFGVLVVEQEDGRLGYLAAFSGKLANANHHDFFVPPVFDLLTEDGFYKMGEAEIIAVTRELESIENDENYLAAKTSLISAKENAISEIAIVKSQAKNAKRQRDQLREENLLNNEHEVDALNDRLSKESSEWNFKIKDVVKFWNSTISNIENQIQIFESSIKEIKLRRKSMSYRLQQQLFDHYHFLNIHKKVKSLVDIFNVTEDNYPPSGAGECAAPKLFQYAFLHDLKPICLAEFWWGQSPASEIRKHGYFYPSCKSKCEPILGHMLDGLEMDENPLLYQKELKEEIEVVFEDEHLVVINKPADFLSVPGKEITESIYTKMLEKYIDADGPLVVHRLDMSTSGLMLIAKSKIVYKQLQSQFVKRKVKKRYVAILDGILTQDNGIIDLPMRVDLDDRPRQMICYEHGKSAITTYEVIERNNGNTRVYLYPTTGRTHQLRVHASHALGLNIPIKGDDLYGLKSDRLYLHAQQITFVHPASRKEVTLNVEPDF